VPATWNWGDVPTWVLVATTLFGLWWAWWSTVRGPRVTIELNVDLAAHRRPFDRHQNWSREPNVRYLLVTVRNLRVTPLTMARVVVDPKQTGIDRGDLVLGFSQRTLVSGETTHYHLPMERIAAPDRMALEVNALGWSKRYDPLTLDAIRHH